MSAEKSSKEKLKIITPEFRVAFPHIFKPSSINDSKLKYSIVMLFQKDQDLKTVLAAMREAKTIAFGPDKDKWPKTVESPFSNGDDEKFAKYQGYQGHWAVKASSGEDYRPGIVDRNNQEIINPADFYPGCYARAQIYAHYWKIPGKQGIMFILENIQKLRDGEPFGGKKPANQVFTPMSAGVDDLKGAGDDAEAEEDFM